MCLKSTVVRFLRLQFSHLFPLLVRGHMAQKNQNATPSKHAAEFFFSMVLTKLLRVFQKFASFNFRDLSLPDMGSKMG